MPNLISGKLRGPDKLFVIVLLVLFNGEFYKIILNSLILDTYLW